MRRAAGNEPNIGPSAVIQMDDMMGFRPRVRAYALVSAVPPALGAGN